MGICIPKSKTRTPFTIRDPKIHETQKACFFSLRHCDVNRMSSAQWVFFSGLFFVQICPKFLDFFQQRQWLNSDTPHFPCFFSFFGSKNISAWLRMMLFLSKHGTSWLFRIIELLKKPCSEIAMCKRTLISCTRSKFQPNSGLKSQTLVEKKRNSRINQFQVLLENLGEDIWDSLRSWGWYGGIWWQFMEVYGGLFESTPSPSSSSKWRPLLGCPRKLVNG